MFLVHLLMFLLIFSSPVSLFVLSGRAAARHWSHLILGVDYCRAIPCANAHIGTLQAWFRIPTNGVSAFYALHVGLYFSQRAEREM